MAVKNRQNLTLRMNIKMFNGNDLPHELLLTTRQKTKLRNAFENNMSLSKAQISEIIQSGELLGSLLSKIAGTLMKEAVSLTKNIWAPFGITAAAWEIFAANQKKKKKKKKNHGSGTTNDFKWRNKWHNENSSSSKKFKYFIERNY